MVCENKIARLDSNAAGEVIVAMSSNFQDTLSVSSYAYSHQMPVFLGTNDAAGRVLPQEAKNSIADMGGTAALAERNGGIMLLANTNPSCGKMSVAIIDGADSEGTMAFPSDRAPLTEQADVLGTRMSCQTISRKSLA